MTQEDSETMMQEQPHSTATAIDPVCGMTVDIAQAVAAGRTAEERGTTYYFCGKGCLLDFHEDPEKYFDPGYHPSM